MEPIKLDWIEGNVIKKLQITQPNGSGGIYYILRDNYFIGQMMKRNCSWEGYFNTPDLGRTEIDFLGDAIDKYSNN